MFPFVMIQYLLFILHRELSAALYVFSGLLLKIFIFCLFLVVVVVFFNIALARAYQLLGWIGGGAVIAQGVVRRAG